MSADGSQPRVASAPADQHRHSLVAHRPVRRSDPNEHRPNISTTVIALWLGHEQESTTRGYLHGDLRLKQRAIDRTAPPHTQPGRYRATDSLLAFLNNL